MNVGGQATFTVGVNGMPTLSYQWRSNGVAIGGATSNSYTINNVQPAQAGSYSVVVSNTVGTVTSAAASLTVQQFIHAAKATATLLNGFVVQLTVTDSGWGYTNTPVVRFIGGGGSGAQAVAVVSNGQVTAVNPVNAGFGYTSTPLVVIDPPFILSPVLSLAPMTFLSFSNLTVGSVYQFQQLQQSYYWSNQPPSFTATNAQFTNIVAGVAGSGSYRLALVPAPAQAFATAQVFNGFVVGVTGLIGGSGYVTPPGVSFVGGGGSNATAVARISGGVVTNIAIVNPGCCYTSLPTVQIDPPPAVAVSPTVFPMMQMKAVGLAPYRNYQIQFKPFLGAFWSDWSGGLFTPTDATNTQVFFITDDSGFFRLKYVP